MAYPMNDIFDKSKLNELAKNIKSEEDLFGENGLVKQFVKGVLESALEAEMAEQISSSAETSKAKNKRNGKSSKTISCDSGEVEIEIPRDRQADFEPKIVKKHQRRLAGLDSKIIAMYARGATTRDIQSQLKEMYDVDVSPTLISQVTDAVLDDVKTWQNRPLDHIYPIVFLDALVVKIKDGRQIINKSVYLALGINLDGQKEVLGLWVSENEGAKFWLSILTELNNRGVKDILIACTDGLTGFPEAIEAVFPKTKIQLCIVHMVRNSTKYVSYKDRKAICVGLKKIYNASTAEAGEMALLEFADKWDAQYPSISKMWQRHWHNIITFFDYPADIRKAIYTTNAIESLNMTIRKVLKNKRCFPSDDAMFKQIYLALNNITKRWTMPIQNWGAAMNHFIIEFEGRLDVE